jgi:hypothetical protein
MPKIKNLAALAAAVEAGRRYARNNPDKAGKYVDQAAAFVDKQTKGKYSGQIDGVVSKVKGAADAGHPVDHDPVDGHAAEPGDDHLGVDQHGRVDRAAGHDAAAADRRPGAHRRPALPGQHRHLTGCPTGCSGSRAHGRRATMAGPTRPVTLLTQGGRGPGPSGCGRSRTGARPGVRGGTRVPAP